MMRRGRTTNGAEQIRLGEMVRIHFEVDPPRGGIVGETMWGEKVAERRYRLRNIPGEVFGVSLNDVVFAHRVRGVLTFTGVSLYAGHSTYRILKARDLDAQVFSRYWEPLKRSGCSYEGNGAGLLAVDVPPQADLRVVHDLLRAGEDAGVWEFEEAHRGQAP
jgi:hypothetical protein